MSGVVVRRFRPLADDPSSEDEADIVSRSTEGSPTAPKPSHPHEANHFTSLDLSLVSSSSSADTDEPAVVKEDEEQHSNNTHEAAQHPQRQCDDEEEGEKASVHDVHSPMHVVAEDTKDAHTMQLPAGSVCEARAVSTAQESVGLSSSSAATASSPTMTTAATATTSSSSSSSSNHMVGQTERHTTGSHSLSKPSVSVHEEAEEDTVDKHHIGTQLLPRHTPCEPQCTQHAGSVKGTQSAYSALNRIACPPAPAHHKKSCTSCPLRDAADAHSSLLLPAAACEAVEEAEQQQNELRLQLPPCVCLPCPTEDTCAVQAEKAVCDVLDDGHATPLPLPALTAAQAAAMRAEVRRSLQEKVHAWQAVHRVEYSNNTRAAGNGDNDACRVVSAWLMREIRRRGRSNSQDGLSAAVVAAMRRELQSEGGDDGGEGVDLLHYPRTSSQHQPQGVV